MTSRVLVVDQDVPLLQALAVQLRSAGHEVALAQTSEQVARHINEQAPDVVVLELDMPSEDGISFPEWIGRLIDVVATPVVYVTSDHSDDVAIRTKRLGAFALVRKPFDASILTTVNEAAACARVAPPRPSA